MGERKGFVASCAGFGRRVMFGLFLAYEGPTRLEKLGERVTCASIENPNQCNWGLGYEQTDDWNDSVSSLRGFYTGKDVSHEWDSRKIGDLGSYLSKHYY